MYNIVYKPKNEIAETTDTYEDAKEILDEIVWYRIADRHDLNPQTMQMKDVDIEEYENEKSSFAIVSA